MDDLDRLLRETGANWRASQPPPVPLNDHWQSQGGSLQRFSANARSLAGGALAVFGVLLAVVVLTGRSSPVVPPQTGTHEGSPLLVHVNDEVIGRGGVVADRGGGTRLCYSSVVPRMLGKPEIELSGPPCPQASVKLNGVKVGELPRWTQWSTVGFSDLVTIRGRWTGDAVDVREVGPYEPRARAAGTGRGCDRISPPVGVQPSGEVAYESALSSLAATLDAKPEVYAGYWTLAPSPSDEIGQRIIVVGTVRDPKSTRDDLARAFPYALCASTVEYSKAQLEQVNGELAKAQPSWVTQLRFDLNRVTAVVPIADEANMRLLDQYPSVVADPLVAKVNP